MDTAATILQILLAAAFTGAGGTKALGVQMQMDNFERWQLPQSYRPFVGGWELLGAAGMAVGIFVNEVAIIAGIWLAVAMLGAQVTHRRINDPISQYIPSLVLLTLSLIVVILRVAEM